MRIIEEAQTRPDLQIWLFHKLLTSATTLPMRSSAEIRADNLRRVLHEHFGGVQARLAGAMDVSASVVSQLLASPPRRQIGEELARKIELACKLPRNWLDQPHDAPTSAQEQPAAYDAAGLGNVVTGSTPAHLAPLLQWDELTRYLAGEPILRELQMLPALVDAPQLAFLTVTGTLMDDGTDSGYRDGELIAVEPTSQAASGDDVIVQMPSGALLFRRLESTPEGSMLRALNDRAPNGIIRMDDGARLLARVIYSAKLRGTRARAAS